MKNAFVLSTALVLAASALSAADTDANRWNADSNGVVLAGYDVVSYFTADRAERGRSGFSANYEGGTFYFASQEHLDLFKQEPAKYAPKFGGYCAYGVAAQKAKVPIEPHTFKIHNGELLLFFNDLYNGEPVNTKILWNQNEASLYEDAVRFWPKVH